ncbi:MAG: ABC transporter substrate-binding protein [Thermodesulfobacteriota bacterium]|jgi:branched-chain amino acid transport system substrate-binding protein
MKRWNKKCWIKLMILTGLMVAAFSPARAAEPGQKVLKIGNINPLTGPAAVWGINTLKYLQLAAQLTNSKGGITVAGQKYDLEIVGVDDKDTVEGGRAAAEKLIYRDKAKFLVGSFRPAPLSGWAPLATKEKILAVIGGPSISPGPKMPYLFQCAASLAERAEALVKLMSKTLGTKRALFLCSDDLDGRLDYDYAFKNKEKWGLEITDLKMVPKGATDLYPFLTEPLKKNPDWIYCKLAIGTTALVVKQARELGYKGYITTPTSMPGKISDWQKIAGVEASQGFIAICDPLSDEGLSPLGKEVLATAQKTLWREGWVLTDRNYNEQFWILKEALEVANTFDPDKLVEVLRKHTFTRHEASFPLKFGGEKTYGIPNHTALPVSFSKMAGSSVQFLSSEYVTSP